MQKDILAMTHRVQIVRLMRGWDLFSFFFPSPCSDDETPNVFFLWGFVDVNHFVESIGHAGSAAISIYDSRPAPDVIRIALSSLKSAVKSAEKKSIKIQ